MNYLKAEISLVNGDISKSLKKKNFLFIFNPLFWIVVSSLFFFYFLLQINISKISSFPFDDSWIHQVYAKNFVSGKFLSYNPNEHALGESSILWMFILSIGYIFKIPPFLFVKIIGYLFYEGIVGYTLLHFNSFLENRFKISSSKSSSLYFNSKKKREFIISFYLLGILLVILNPILVWMLLSGMSAGFVSFLLVSLSWDIQSNNIGRIKWKIPLLFFARGETIFIIIFIILWMLSIKQSQSIEQAKIKSIKYIRRYPYFVQSLISLIITIVIYLSINYYFGKSLFPNTFYIKTNFIGNLYALLKINKILIFFSSFRVFFELQFWLYSFLLSLLFLVFVINLFLKIKEKIENKENNENNRDNGNMKNNEQYYHLLASLGIFTTIFFALIAHPTFPSINISYYYLKYWFFVLPFSILLLFKKILNINFKFPEPQANKNILEIKDENNENKLDTSKRKKEDLKSLSKLTPDYKINESLVKNKKNNWESFILYHLTHILVIFTIILLILYFYSNIFNNYFFLLDSVLSGKDYFICFFISIILWFIKLTLFDNRIIKKSILNIKNKFKYMFSSIHTNKTNKTKTKYQKLLNILPHLKNSIKNINNYSFTPLLKALSFLSIILISISYPYQVGSFIIYSNEINSQQVQIGLWIEQNYPSGTIIATHDAGAIRYFSENPVIDLWGLNDNNIARLYNIKFSTDPNIQQEMLEKAIWNYCISRNVSLFVIREDLFKWITNQTIHPELSVIKRFTVNNSITLGNDTMIVYEFQS